MNLDEDLEKEQKEIKIKIRTLDTVNNELIIEIQKDSTIKALKEKIALVIIIIFIILSFKYLEISNSYRETTFNISWSCFR